MQVYKRSLVALAIAAMLPTLAFASLQGIFALRTAQDQVRAEAREQVGLVNELTEAELAADARVLNTVVLSPPLVAGDWRTYRPRAERVLEANRTWRALIVTNPATGRVVFGLRRSADGLRDAVEPMAAPKTVDAVTTGGVVRDIDGAAVVPVHAPVLDGTRLKFVLTVLKDPAPFQDILMRWAPKAGVSAITDREGRFVARSLDPEHKIGELASESLRGAIAAGASGEYRGRTLEGAITYTQYAAIAPTGWSTHVASPSDRIDLPRGWSLALAALGALGALGLAGVLTTLVLRDMAERRKAEDALRHAQKMEAVGQLTGGIAHDFNNLLTPIIGGLERIKTRLGADERTHRILDNALEAAQRAAKLTAQLLAFSRSQRMELTVIDVRGLLDGVRDLLLHSVGQNVRLEIVAPAGLFVRSDASQLELALINLAVNARDAMPRGGVLTIAVKPVERRGDADTPASAFVDIAVSDTGTGMTEEVRARALEPFFTTKPTGAGTGLGLSQVFAVARQSGGDVEIHSTPGRGTTIHIQLPRAEGDAPPAPLIPHPGNDVADPRPRATVLVVDDDAHVRAHIVDTLEAANFKVIAATGGEAALQTLRMEPVDLLLADFAMPGMNGAELIRTARSRHAGLRALIVSGYSDSAAIDAAAGDVRVLRKPFDVGTLVGAVSETLGR